MITSRVNERERIRGQCHVHTIYTTLSSSVIDMTTMKVAVNAYRERGEELLLILTSS